MDVVKDVLDREVVDRNGRVMGRVDGLLIELEANAPPTLATILVGPSALGDRLHPRVGRAISAIERRFGLDSGRPARIAFQNLELTPRRIRVRLAIGDTAVEAVEQRLRRWIAHLPGSR